MGSTCRKQKGGQVSALESRGGVALEGGELCVCGFSFAVVTHRGSGFQIPGLPKAEIDWLVWSDMIGLPLRGRGEGGGLSGG